MKKGKQIHGDDVRRFWSWVSVDQPCWIWRGTSNANSGYGQFMVGGRKGKMTYAHRYSYEIHFGAIPEGIYVCHTCDNKVCVNPGHLFLGTPKENTQDGIRKGRIKRVKSSKLTERQVLEIRASNERGCVISKRYKVSDGTISEIRNGITWSHIPNERR